MKVDTSLATVFNEKCGWENDYNIRSSVKAIRVLYFTNLITPLHLLYVRRILLIPSSDKTN